MSKQISKIRLEALNLHNKCFDVNITIDVNQSRNSLADCIEQLHKIQCKDVDNRKYKNDSIKLIEDFVSVLDKEVNMLYHSDQVIFSMKLLD